MRTRHHSLTFSLAPFALLAPIVLGSSIAEVPGHASAATGHPQTSAIFDHTEISEKHTILASEALALLPRECQGTLRSFVVRYDHPRQRGLAGKSSMVLAGHVPDSEFRALFIHEFGHITDLGCLEGRKSSGPSGFQDGDEIIFRDDPSVSFYHISWVDEFTQKKEARPEDFVSGYARKDAFEDFAESYAYYVLQRAAFEERAKENRAVAMKLTFLKTHIFRSHLYIAEGHHVWDGNTIPWDVTKLPYEMRRRSLASGHARP